MVLCVLVWMTDAVVEDVTLANVLLNCSAAQNSTNTAQH